MTTKCSLIVIDNFYENPLEVRQFALKQNYHSDYYYPGNRSTFSFTNDEMKNKIEQIIKPFGGNIISFPINNTSCDNGHFQYSTLKDKTWIHNDELNTNWGGIIYLTPDAPVSSGTSIFRHKESNLCHLEKMKNSNDYSKWEIVDNIGNVFNRLLLFDSQLYHASSEYFGTDINNSRLFQVFFFQSEY
jgi:hypothetical protein